MRWSPPTWAASLLSYHSFYIAYAGKKLKKAENNEQTFFWTNNYLKRTIVRYGLSPLARTLISFMSSWIFFTLPTRRSRQKRASSRPKIPRTYRDQRFPFRSSLSLFFIMPLPSCFLLIVACTDQRKHGEKAPEKQGLYASQGHDYHISNFNHDTLHSFAILHKKKAFFYWSSKSAYSTAPTEQWHQILLAIQLLTNCVLPGFLWLIRHTIN